MSRTSGGGQATTTREARTVPRSVCTSTYDEVWWILRTGALSATRLPSWLAIRSGTSCEPPTKRLSCAAPEVPDERSKVPLLFSSPAVAMYQRKNRNDMSTPSLPKHGWR
jgi:hypothetical protein